MRRIVGATLIVGTAVGLGVFAAWWTVVGFVALCAAWPLIKCTHPGQLGLLPPVTGPDGIKTPARWYCDRCGRSWPAGIEHGPQPIQRFSGFDQTKAVRAAARAGALDAAQRVLAVKRSGVASATPPAPSAQALGKKRAVPFGPRREPDTVGTRRLAG